MRRTISLLAFVAGLAGSVVVQPPARAGSIIDDAVFAHDFESIAGDAITALKGPAATKTSNVAADGTDPVRATSAQQLRAPIGSTFATVNTNTRLEASTTQMSFSIFYNDRGDDGGSDSSSSRLTRLLSNYNGTGLNANETLFDLISSSGRRLRFITESTITLSEDVLPFRDGLWHQAGFVFDAGVLTFYFDGERFGSPIVIPGVTTISRQELNWFLIEDARSVSAPSEYFDGGNYDEAALWYRALADEEMRSLYRDGFTPLAVVPEPSSIALAMAGMIPIVWLRVRRTSAEHRSADFFPSEERS